MNKGRTLAEVAAELDRQSATKRDYLSQTTALALASDKGTGSQLQVNGVGEFPVSDVAHEQIATHLGIPKKYYDRLRVDYPELLDDNVNRLFRAEPARRMIRTLDGRARAFLSNRYRLLDNADLLGAIFPQLKRLQDEMSGPLTFASCEITERRLYLKVIANEITAEVKVGDVVRAGVAISNSEIGYGSCSVLPFIDRLCCTNGLIATEYGSRKFHVGRGFGESSEAAYELFSDETIRQDDKAFWLKVADVVRSVLSRETFTKIVERMRETTEKRIEGDPEKAVEVVARTFDLSDSERGSVFRHLISGGDLSQWGVVNAITRTAQDTDDYDRATDFERFGGTALAFNGPQWQQIARPKDVGRVPRRSIPVTITV